MLPLQTLTPLQGLIRNVCLRTQPSFHQHPRFSGNLRIGKGGWLLVLDQSHSFVISLCPFCFLKYQSSFFITLLEYPFRVRFSCLNIKNIHKLRISFCHEKYIERKSYVCFLLAPLAWRESETLLKSFPAVLQIFSV